MARRGIGLVYGGATVGLMGIVADTVLEHGGEVIGVIPSHFSPEISHQGLAELRVVPSMHDRKAAMADLADAFITLPGAYGTLDEFCEILAWSQLRIHKKPCGLLNVARYWDPFLAFLDNAVREQFLKAEHRGLFIEETEPERLVERVVEAWNNGRSGAPGNQSSNIPSNSTVLK